MKNIYLYDQFQEMIPNYRTERRPEVIQSKIIKRNLYPNKQKFIWRNSSQ